MVATPFVKCSSVVAWKGIPAGRNTVMDIGIWHIRTTLKIFIVNIMELGGGICHTHKKILIHNKRPRMINHQLNTKCNNEKAFLAA